MTKTPSVLQLQQQAAARVREMEERSRRLVQEHPVNLYRGVTLAPYLERQPPRDMPAPAEAPPPPVATSPRSVCAAPREKNGLLSLLSGDNEQLLLLLLAAVLAKNGAPLELLLALLYIAL